MAVLLHLINHERKESPFFANFINKQLRKFFSIVIF
jgi:hypothetical protein